MYVRAYAAGDFDRLHALDQACFPPRIAYSEAELRGFLESPSTFTAVVVESASGSIQGFAVVRNVRVAERAVLHIITIDVDPGSQRRGIGKLLMRWMEGQAQALESTAMRLEVAEDNAPAQAFYRSAGFEVRGRIPGYYAPRMDALVMERPLESISRSEQSQFRALGKEDS